MKIAFTHLNLSIEAGDPRMMYILAGTLQKMGHSITVYTAKYDPAAFPDLHTGLGIREISAPLGEMAFNLSPWQKISERIQRERLNTAAAQGIAAAMDADFDIVIMENDQTYKLSEFYRAKNPRAKFIWIMNNAPFRHTKKDNFVTDVLSQISGAIERVRVRHYLPLVDKIVVNDEEQKKLCRQVGAEAVLMPIPVNFEKFYRPVRRPGLERPLLLGVGSLSRARNYEDILRAALILRKQGIDCQVALVCKDIWKSTEYQKELLDIARQDSDGSWGTFYFEGVNDETLLDLQSKAFAFVSPNRLPIWAMAASEAMAAGLPAVLSSAISITGMLKDGVNALIVRPAHPEEIAGRIKGLLEDAKMYESIAQAGQDFVKTNLDWQSYAQKILQF